MNIFIKRSRAWLDRHERVKQWLWFVALWCGGLLAAMAAAYPFKLIIKSMK